MQVPQDLAALGRGEPSPPHQCSASVAAGTSTKPSHIPERRRSERARRRRSLLGTERDGLHAAGEAGLLLRRRDRRRRRRGLLPLQGLQARPRLHGPPGTRSAPSSAPRLDLRFLRAYRNSQLGPWVRLKREGAGYEWNGDRGNPCCRWCRDCFVLPIIPVLVAW
jgi:hypothetical protein